MEGRAGHAMIDYLDNVFMVQKLAYVCSNIMVSFKQVCDEIRMPISPDKAVGPIQVIQFLGLTIDTILIVIKVPEDKRVDILKILTKMIQKRKATSLVLQALAGKLNFLCTVVPAWKPYIQTVYQAFVGVPQHRYIDLKGNVLADMRMWKSFLVWQPIISNAERSHNAVEVFSDATGNPLLRWGAFFPAQGLWMYQKWDLVWFQEYNPSIDFLELYALLVGMVMWAPHLSNKTVIF